MLGFSDFLIGSKLSPMPVLLASIYLWHPNSLLYIFFSQLLLQSFGPTFYKNHLLHDTLSMEAYWYSFVEANTVLAGRERWPDLQILSHMSFIWRWLILVQVSPGASPIFAEGCCVWSVDSSSDHVVTEEQRKVWHFYQSSSIGLLPNFYEKLY